MKKRRGDSLLTWTIILAVASASFILMRGFFKDALRHKVEDVSAYLLWNQTNSLLPNGTSYAPIESETAAKQITYTNQSQSVQKVERKVTDVTAKSYEYSVVSTDERSASASAEDGAEHIVKTIDISTVVP